MATINKEEHNVCDFCEDRHDCVSLCPTKLIEEQKSTDKVEPKFNVGDVIVKNNSDINHLDLFTITDITGGKYWYNDRIICDITEQNEWTLFDVIY